MLRHRLDLLVVEVDVEDHPALEPLQHFRELGLRGLVLRHVLRREPLAHRDALVEQEPHVVARQIDAVIGHRVSVLDADRLAGTFRESEVLALAGPPLLERLGDADRSPGELLERLEGAIGDDRPAVVQRPHQRVDRGLGAHGPEIVDRLHARPPVRVGETFDRQLLHAIGKDLRHRAQQRTAHTAVVVAAERLEELRRVSGGVDAGERFDRVGARIRIAIARGLLERVLGLADLHHAETACRPSADARMLVAQRTHQRARERRVPVDAQQLDAPLANPPALRLARLLIDPTAGVRVLDARQRVPHDVAVVRRREVRHRAALLLLEHLEQGLDGRLVVELPAHLRALADGVLVRALQFLPRGLELGVLGSEERSREQDSGHEARREQAGRR